MDLRIIEAVLISLAIARHSAYARRDPLSFCDNSPVSVRIAPRGEASYFICVRVRSAAFVLSKTRSIGPLLRSLYSK